MLQTAVRVALSPSPLSLTVTRASLDRIECSSTSLERTVPIVKVFARRLRLWLSNFQVLGAVSTPTVPSFSQRLWVPTLPRSSQHSQTVDGLLPSVH